MEEEKEEDDDVDLRVMVEKRVEQLLVEPDEYDN